MILFNKERTPRVVLLLSLVLMFSLTFSFSLVSAFNFEDSPATNNYFNITNGTNFDHKNLQGLQGGIANEYYH